MPYHMRRLSAIVLALVAVCSVLSAAVSAAVPKLIRYQGQAVDSKGVPLEGPYTLTFRLYDAATGGAKVWEETQANVALTEGHFSVLLGQVTALNVDWNRPLWLSVQVNQNPELTPRQQITSVPLAIRAEVADQLAVPVTTSTITDDGNRLVPAGAIILWNGASCPAGYTRVSALDGKFLVSGTNYNATAGGSNTHTHAGGSFSGTTTNESDNRYLTVENGNPNDRIAGGDGSAPVKRWSHTHNFSGTTGSTGSADSRPEFATVLLCQKN